MRQSGLNGKGPRKGSRSEKQERQKGSEAVLINKQYYGRMKSEITIIKIGLNQLLLLENSSKLTIVSHT